MAKKIDAVTELAKILQTEVNKVIDEELIKAIKDPNYKPDLTPIIFESEEDRQKYRENVRKNLKG